MSIKFDASEFVEAAYILARALFFRCLTSTDARTNLPTASFLAFEAPVARRVLTRRGYLAVVKISIATLLPDEGRELLQKRGLVWPPADVELWNAFLIELAAHCVHHAVEQVAADRVYSGEPGGFRRARKERVLEAIAEGLRTKLPAPDIRLKARISRSAYHRYLAAPSKPRGH